LFRLFLLDVTAYDRTDYFLDQIEHTRLAAIVAVPLLATSATVFQADVGHLSPSRYGLYERFVSYLLLERPKNGTATSSVAKAACVLNVQLKWFPAEMLAGGVAGVDAAGISCVPRSSPAWPRVRWRKVGAGAHPFRRCARGSPGWRAACPAWCRLVGSACWERDLRKCCQSFL
jgi:hypothetical protein